MDGVHTDLTKTYIAIARMCHPGRKNTRQYADSKGEATCLREICEICVQKKCYAMRET